jgi:hypothetical protein
LRSITARFRLSLKPENLNDVSQEVIALVI